MSIEEFCEEMESLANFMRGMCLDPAVPKHAKEALAGKIKKIEKVVQAFLDIQDEEM